MPVRTLVVDGRDVAPVVVADSYLARLRGMLGRRPLPPALLLVPARSVHGVGMREPLDVAAIDAAGSVLDVRVLRPFGLTPTIRGGTQVLEAPVGSFGRWGLAVGSVVTLGAGSS
ncbi:hypothetical protein Cch01nite_01180 [Cellulomonas chitinilytica]|uniref:DUF192 domain-containing protein n=1 Tax=Cellulomonas chitinilytica TaxID=398759 RepID=A0A919P1G3_9CELL|nr:DUF192 domain-containing protein [Cellulomonas chitinilytica]GIG19394.1 hypothetical protein Cch01nite_01180 [Cellulomonas chitinilytica]